jgi:hypothetical protein
MARPSPLLRKKKVEETFDPVSAGAWAAGAKATAKVLELLKLLRINPAYYHEATPLFEQLNAATALSPCAVKSDARTKPRRQWSFQDYLLTVRVGEALRKIVVDGVDFVPKGQLGLFDTMREDAAKAIIVFVDEIEKYTTLVKRERAMERISGTESLRRGLR